MLNNMYNKIVKEREKGMSHLQLFLSCELFVGYQKITFLFYILLQQHFILPGPDMMDRHQTE